MADEAQAMTLVTQLVTLLDDQISSAENGQFERVESLMEASSALTSQVVEARAFDFETCQARQGEIRKKYRRLELMLTSAKEITKGELKQAKRTTKMLAVYRSSNR